MSFVKDPTEVYDIIKMNEAAIIGNENGLKINKKGELDMKVEHNDGSTCN